MLHYHARRLYVGTTAERTTLASSLDTENIGVRFWDTDTGGEYAWSGTAWIASDLIPSTRVNLDLIAGAGYEDLQDWINTTQSAGRLVDTDGLLTANIAADGTLDISAGEGFIKVTASHIGATKFFDWDAVAALALADKDVNYIYVDYDVGTTVVTVLATTDRTTIDGQTEFTLGRVYRDGNDLHIMQSGVNLYNHVWGAHQRLIDVRGFERASGGVISETGERYLFATAGKFYLGANPNTTAQQDTSGAERFSYWYNDGAWQEVTGQQQLGNTQYNDYGTGLANLTADEPYGVYWVYIHYDGDLQVIYGVGKYKLADAEAAILPPNVPEHAVCCFATLAAKIIFKRNEANFESVVSAYETLFPVSSPANHNDLGELQGGTTDEYYHFTSAQHTLLADFIIADGVTKTVKAAAGDFTTIQAAVNWFKGRAILGDCKIEVEAAAYDEGVVFEDILIVPGSTLTLEGDTRVLAGLSYVVGSMANRAALSNGGTFNDANRCTLTVNAAGDEITVAGGTVDPDFDDATSGMWGDGDHILVFGDDEVIYEHEVNAIIGADNTIELKVALDAAAFPGGGGALSDGSAICLMPNREIDRTTAGRCITVNSVRGAIIDGFYLESHTGATCDGVYAANGAVVSVEGVACNIEDYGVYSNGVYSTILSSDGALSVWGGSRGFVANSAAQAFLLYACLVDCSYGVYSNNFAIANTQQCIVTHCGRGFRARQYSYVNAGLCGARQCANVGYESQLASYIYATSTIANNNGNVADYAPDPGGVGSAQDANFATMYSS